MEVDYLSVRAGVSLLNAKTAAIPEARKAHEALAGGYSDRLAVILLNRATPLGDHRT